MNGSVCYRSRNFFGANNLLLDPVVANEACEPIRHTIVTEQELTEAEKALIHSELPSDLKTR